MENKLILGTVQFGLDYGINNVIGRQSFSNLKIILDTAFQNGIDFLDTAEAYGESQKTIGKYHKNSKNQFKIITKFSSNIKNLPRNIVDRVKKNSQILHVDQLYCYMFHSYNDFREYYNDFKEGLARLKEEKIILKIGVSLYMNEEFEQVLKYDDIDLVQLPYNLLDNQTKRGEILSKGKNRGLEIHTRSVFLQGLFFKDSNNLPIKLKPLKSTLNKLQSLCGEYIKMNDLALNYAYANDKIDKVLIGVDNVEQLMSNISSKNKNLSKDTIERIDLIKLKEEELLNPSNW